MKRLILISTLLLLVLASCDSPVSDVNSAQQQSTKPEATLTQIPPGTPPAQADSIRKANWRQFKDRHGPEWQIRWSENTGLPVSIFSGLTAKAYPREARQAARAFLVEYQTLFGFTDLNRLQHVKTRTHRGIRHVTFNQTVKGVPVYEAEYKVHLRPDGRVDMANGTYYPAIEVTTTPSISQSQAKSSAELDLNIAQGIDLQTTSELVIYPEEEQFYLAWKLELYSESPQVSWFYIVDAHSGKTLYKLNQLMDVTGDGDVYPTHPGLSYVTNRSLYRLNGNGRLQGVYADIVNDEDSEAYSSTHSFRYSPSNTHFDETNLYYNIDDFRPIAS